MKRLIDVTGATIAIVLALPILLCAIAAILVEDGRPVLFRQPRLGRRGRVFRMVKLRSMRVNAADLRRPDGSTWNSEIDPRVTAVGHVIRRWSVDEIPQLLNVLAGDMSLVGPRPDLTDAARFYAPGDVRRLDVLPGMTGLAQVMGRNGLSWVQRRRWDRWYVAHRSTSLDLWILLRTIPLVLSKRGVMADAVTRPNAT